MSGRRGSLPALSAAVFAALVIASFAGFFLAQRLKHIPTAVQSFYIDPGFRPEGGPPPHREAISFEIERADRVTVEIIDQSGADVATLTREHRLAAYQTMKLAWSGRRGAHGDGRRRPVGPPARAGEYRVRIILARRKFETLSPTAFALIRKGRR